MKPIISYFSRNTNHIAQGGALISGAFYEDWVQNHRIFERLCNYVHLTDEDNAKFLRMSLHAGALSFYDDSTRGGFFSYSAQITALAAMYDSPSRLP